MVNFIWQLASFLFGFIVVVLLLIALIALIKASIEGVIKDLKE
nr:MAG TPA: Lipopolysaccharide assembly protein A domain [Caudoviricetes sp.]